jgi:hypothetical protein
LAQINPTGGNAVFEWGFEFLGGFGHVAVLLVLYCCLSCVDKGVFYALPGVKIR